MRKITIVSCTKHNEENFYNKTALGKTLKKLLKLDIIDRSIIFFENSRGLCECYNEAIDICLEDNTLDTMMVFVHDDVFIEDISINEKLERAFKTHKILGMAGSTKWSLTHPTTWHNTKCEWSGVVPHYIDDEYRTIFFGKYGINCVVLDGLLLAVELKTFRENNELRFDSRLKFHHYDIDFCLTAKKLGMKMTTVPLWVVHCSEGNWKDDRPPRTKKGWIQELNKKAE